jgi:hypothetical protein
MQVAVLGTERAKDMRIEGKHAIDPAVSVVTVKVTGSRSPFTPAPVPVSPSHDTTGKRPVSTRFQLAAWSLCDRDKRPLPATTIFTRGLGALQMKPNTHKETIKTSDTIRRSRRGRLPLIHLKNKPQLLWINTFF